MSETTQQCLRDRNTVGHHLSNTQLSDSTDYQTVHGPVRTVLYLRSTCRQMMASKPQKKKRVVSTIEDKLELYELVCKGRNMTSVSEEYDGRPTVHNIVKSEDKLKTFQTELEDDCAKKRRAIRRSDLPELDKATHLWFVQQRCQG